MSFDQSFALSIVAPADSFVADYFHDALQEYYENTVTICFKWSLILVLNLDMHSIGI